jgi:hypothetical protein
MKENSNKVKLYTTKEELPEAITVIMRGKNYLSTEVALSLR